MPAMTSSGRVPSERIAASADCAVRATVPRQPACTQASTWAAGSYKTMGTQSATRIASTMPGVAVTRASAGPTASPGTVLAILVADCVPVILYDPAAHVLACVHAGWRGTVARTAQAAVAAMCSLGTRPEDVIAGIGPSVAAGSYQVGQEVAAAARDAFGEEMAGTAGGAFGGEAASTAQDAFAEEAAGPARDASGRQARALLRPAAGGGPGQWLFDLPAANRHVLRGAGVTEGQIHVTATSTGPDPGLFFSHRAERPCGRFALAARLEPQEQG